MKPVDYDAIAPAFEQRYRSNRFEGVRATLAAFLNVDSARDVLEIGCGTGHWLSIFENDVRLSAGLDSSMGMLARARERVRHAFLVRGSAESLPFSRQSFDRLFCINALHHFPDAKLFVQEARRALRPGGGLLSVGIDPHTGIDQWWVYDYFPTSLIADRARYTPTATIRAIFESAGLVAVSTKVAQHIPADVSFASALEQGFLDRRSTSQLLVIDDEQWVAGLARLHAEQPVLRADLRLYATVGWLPLNSTPVGARTNV
jgi:ubiquinone/menaquinone biosynthesis C-methylase UbiE